MITNHMLNGAVNAPSPNRGGAIVPKFIVMHYTASWDEDSVIATFNNRASKVSAHLTIDTDGTIYQHVPFNLRAWHAGPSSFGGYTGLNSHSIGIEFVNPGFLRKTADGRYRDARGDVFSAKTVGDVFEAAHSRVGSGVFYWPFYTKAQLEAGERVTKELIETYSILDIVTHEEIDTRGWKTDPGPAFPMNRFRALLGDRGNDVVRYAVIPDSLNMRGGPGAQFEILGKLSRGALVEAVARKGDWVRINDQAWVHGEFLRLVA